MRIDPCLETSFGVAFVASEHFLIGNKAMKNRSNGHVKNVHEKVTDPVRRQKYDGQWTPNRIQLVVNVVLCQQQVGTNRRHGTDKQLPNNQDGSRNIRDCSDAAGVAKDEPKGLLTRLAEGAAKDCRLDVSILGHKLETLFQAAEATLTTA